MSATELLLIDLSGIAHQIWHTDTNNPDPSRVSTQTIARVRALASEHPHAAVCCDSGKSFRADLDPAYKANRDTENRAPLRHQMTLACETLKKDGFPVWAATGFEADDIIATATTEALRMDPDVSVLIASADKDLLQLVSERVRMKKITDGAVVGPAEVQQKFKVTPAQMLDYLCLVGDTSDNITGAKGIGGVNASKLLNMHGSIAKIYDKMAHGVVPGMTPAIRSSFEEFRDRWPVVAKLVELRADVPIPFAEIASERTAAAMVEGQDMEHDNMGAVEPGPESLRELNQNDSLAALGGATTRVAERIHAAEKQDQPTATHDIDGALKAKGLRDVDGPTQAVVPYAAPVDFSQQLEPQNMQEAVVLADRMFQSKLFMSAFGAPQAVLAVILAGRELGFQAMASLRAFHIIEGKPMPSADTLAALVMKSGKAKYFRCSERTPEKATFVTQRLPVEDYPPQTLTFTIAEAKAAWKKDQKAWDASGWGKVPSAMLVARAKSALARLEYPDVVGNLYGAEEME